MRFRKSIAVIGAGALGSYYGAKLARQGADVRFLMRADLEAVRKDGLRVREQGQEWSVPVQAFGSTAEIGPVDLVIIGLKTTANATWTLIPPLLHEWTCCSPCRMAWGMRSFSPNAGGPERVLGGLCFVCLNRVAPGVIEHYGHGTLSLGEFGRSAAGADACDRRDVFRGGCRDACGGESHHGALAEAGLEHSLQRSLHRHRWADLRPVAGGCGHAAAGARADGGNLVRGRQRWGTSIPDELHRSPDRAHLPYGTLQAIEHDRLAARARGGSGINLGRTMAPRDRRRRGAPRLEMLYRLLQQLTTR